MIFQSNKDKTYNKEAMLFQEGGGKYLEGWKKVGTLWWGMAVKEIKQFLVMKSNLSVIGNNNIHNNITINEISFTKICGATKYLSQVNKVFRLPYPFNQHLYNIYKFKYIISWSYLQLC